MDLWCRAIILALVSVAFASPARACSVAPDYVRPSNFELVQLADAIVIAVAESEDRGEDVVGSVTFRVERVVKGMPPAQILLNWSALGNTIRSDLADLSGSHPEGHTGPCNRVSFRRGGRYLLFLARVPEGHWEGLPYPFSRINEDYAGEDNAWMRSVRRYLRLQQGLAPMDQVEALRAMLESGRDRDEPLTPGEIADIRDHLGSLSPWKPTAFLLDALARLDRGEAPEFGTRPDAVNRENSNAETVAALLLDEPLEVADGGSLIWRQRVLESLVSASHPDALPLFERLLSAGGADDVGYALRFFARNGQYRRAYRWIESNLLGLLPRLDAAAAQSLLAAVEDMQRGGSWEESEARWRNDPHAAATWPELAFAVRRYAMGALDAEYGPFADAIAALPLTDYRARPDLTLLRAADYDEDVDAWAGQELSRSLPPSDGNDLDTHPALLPLQALAIRWSAERFELLDRLSCSGGGMRALVIIALGRSGDEMYEPILGEIASAPDLSEQERSLVLRAALGFTLRQTNVRNVMRWSGTDDPDWLLARLLRGQTRGGAQAHCTQ